MKKSFCFPVVLIFCVLNILHAEEYFFIGTFVKNGDLVFDVGAHIGKKTELYLALGARVICFEPQPNCFVQLSKKFSTNNNVTLLQKGLASESGQLDMAICSAVNTISTFSTEWQENSRFSEHGYVWDKILTVEVTTLDEMINQYGCPQFCKIDVENFEYDVLKGLSISIPLLSFEYAIETIHNAEKCVEHLKSLGYQYFNYTIAEISRFELVQWVGPDDIIAVLKEHANSKDWTDIWGIWGDIYAKYE